MCLSCIPLVKWRQSLICSKIINFFAWKNVFSLPLHLISYYRAIMSEYDIGGCGWRGWTFQPIIHHFYPVADSICATVWQNIVWHKNAFQTLDEACWAQWLKNWNNNNKENSLHVNCFYAKRRAYTFVSANPQIFIHI